jgi:hypothetical protein
MKLLKGELCYIPQDVTLQDRHTAAPSGYIRTIKPQAAVIIDELSNAWLKVFFQGGEWYVQKNKVYPMNKEEMDVNQAYRGM